MLEKLNEEDKKLFEEYSDAQSEESSLHGDARFIRGFRLGVLMMMEVMTDGDGLVLHGSDSPE